MRLTKLSWVGISLIASAIILAGTWSVTLETAINKPIDMPLTSLNGIVRTHPFKVNRNRLYTIRVVAKKNIPFDTLNCLLGMQLNPTPRDRPSVIAASWSLSSDGKVLERGNGDGDSGGAWAQDDIERELGRFQSKSGTTYELSVDFTKDAGALTPTEPHLQVEVSTDYYEGDIWISFFLRLVCFGLAVTGISLLVASALRVFCNRRRPAAV